MRDTTIICVTSVTYSYDITKCREYIVVPTVNVGKDYIENVLT